METFFICFVVEAPILFLIGIAIRFAWCLIQSNNPDRIIAFGWFAFTLGLAIFLIAAQVSIVVDFAQGPPLDFTGWNYAFITWSPDASRLAFGIAEDMWGNRSLIVMAADGGDINRLVFTEKDAFFEQRYVYDIQWAESGETLYFETSDHDTRYDDSIPPDEQLYIIGEEGGMARQVASFEFPAVPTWENRDPSPPPTACDEPHYKTSRVLHQNGLLAQSACIQTEYGWSVPLHECYQDLQICDTTTGEMILVYDDNPLYDRPLGVPECTARVSGIVTLGGLAMVVGNALYRLIRRSKNHLRGSDRSEIQGA
jgi:hypothetical protein